MAVHNTSQLRERKQIPSDSMPEVGQSMQQLITLADPAVPFDVKEILAKEYLFDAVTDSDIRLCIKQVRLKGRKC